MADRATELGLPVFKIKVQRYNYWRRFPYSGLRRIEFKVPQEKINRVIVWCPEEKDGFDVFKV